MELPVIPRSPDDVPSIPGIDTIFPPLITIVVLSPPIEDVGPDIPGREDSSGSSRDAGLLPGIPGTVWDPDMLEFSEKSPDADEIGRWSKLRRWLDVSDFDDTRG